MSEICLERCAPARDYQDFKLKDSARLETAPRFPIQEFMEQMPPKVRQVVVAAYMVLIVDHLQGVERYERPILRPHAHRIGSVSLSEVIQVAGLPDDPKEEDPPHPPVTAPDRDPGK